MFIQGNMLIGQQSVKGNGRLIHAVNPATGERLEPGYGAGDASDVDRACQLAWEAFHIYRRRPQRERAAFLRAVASEIEGLGDALIERAMQESGLPRGRLEGERGRTCGQLRLFADVVKAGEWLDVRVDPALPERTPLPRSDLRQRHIGVGPVAVFGASNFPLAFSVAGGDTASALAAGCPVVVKAHSAHPCTSELVGFAVQKAVQACGLPEGVFSLLFGSGRDLGQALVAHPRIQAVGFTGSRAGGLALMKAAQARPQPIPVYAEMSSLNPVFLLPQALADSAEALADGFVGSLTMGAGQFCTNPGLVVALAGPDLERFMAQAGKMLSGSAAQTMLTPGIHDAYQQGVQQWTSTSAREVARGEMGPESDNACQAALFATTASEFLTDESLHEEVFGSASLVVECQDEAELLDIIDHLEGQLTATLHMADSDAALAGKLMAPLELKAGRILANGWPTGVEVCHAMVHGGPFPATSDTRSTSVGSGAIHRFLRPVCYQNLADALLPDELKQDNPLGVPRLVDGKREV
ncbi:aldehyde dehydrogenase (NADP(+)) [Vreelandella olivaria]|uniref:aldehyde dehydrogenase (NADP(+)) n=1 Tax=Vreelandella olivaria TaxID=390919 RepID=UPI00201F8B3B|nr:aldehyde dehydrogenase (NADP(+)) [Halomonas olivaria]